MQTKIPAGWIAHDGGECPVPLDSRVDVIFRDGEYSNGDKANCWDWSHEPRSSLDIIAYRPEENNDGQ